MRRQIIQYNKLSLKKWLLENQVEQEETIWKVYKLI